MYPSEYIQYIAHFHGDRDYFECHELLEEYWKKVDPRNKRSIYVGFIQLAVSQYHQRRTNYVGAERTINKAIEIFHGNKKSITSFGIHENQFLQLLGEKQEDILFHRPYQSMYLPISDAGLIQESIMYCQKNALPWWQNSDNEDLEIVHRHTLRDRSDVIAERARNLSKHKKKQ